MRGLVLDFLDFLTDGGTNGGSGPDRSFCSDQGMSWSGRVLPEAERRFVGLTGMTASRNGLR